MRRADYSDSKYRHRLPWCPDIPVVVRADVIRQFHERGDDEMVEVLTDLEADELLRLQVVEALRRLERH